MVGILNKTACNNIKNENLLGHSIEVLQALGKDIVDFCSQEKTAIDIRFSMNTLFRAILLDGITMRDLIGETQIIQKLKTVQGQFMNAVKENKPLQLNQYLDVPLLNAAIAEYIELIQVHMKQGLKGALAKAKANAAQGIPEIIKIAVNKRFQENLAKKHENNAKFGWYRYDSRFALPIFDENGEVMRYNVFHPELVIRHSSDGKLYLFDVINIKKETGLPLGQQCRTVKNLFPLAKLYYIYCERSSKNMYDEID